jgi:hypothetical protein
MGVNGMLPTRKEVGQRLLAGTNLAVSMLFMATAVLGTIGFVGWVVWEVVLALGVWVLYGLFGALALFLCLYALGQVALAKGWEQTKEQKEAKKKADMLAVARRMPARLDRYEYQCSTTDRAY